MFLIHLAQKSRVCDKFSLHDLRAMMKIMIMELDYGQSGLPLVKRNFLMKDSQRGVPIFHFFSLLLELMICWGL